MSARQCRPWRQSSGNVCLVSGTAGLVPLKRDRVTLTCASSIPESDSSRHLSTRPSRRSSNNSSTSCVNLGCPLHLMFTQRVNRLFCRTTYFLSSCGIERMDATLRASSWEAVRSSGIFADQRTASYATFRRNPAKQPVGGPRSCSKLRSQFALCRRCRMLPSRPFFWHL